jgi:hypothetical protein
MAGPQTSASDWELVDDPSSDWEALPETKQPSLAAGMGREAALGAFGGLGVAEGNTPGDVLKKTGISAAKLFEIGPTDEEATERKGIMEKARHEGLSPLNVADVALSGAEEGLEWLPVAGPAYRIVKGLTKGTFDAGGDIGEGATRAIQGDKQGGLEEAAHGGGTLAGTILGGELMGGEIRSRFGGARPEAPPSKPVMVPDDIISPHANRRPRSPSAPTTIEGEQVSAHQRRSALPESLDSAAQPARPTADAKVLPPHSDGAQPRSDLSETDRSALPGKLVPPESLDIDWDSHPFMLEDDTAKAAKRITEGEQPTAIVRTKDDGRMEVVDGHGSTMAALQTRTPIKVTELANAPGEEGIGARTASHYLAEDKPEITANFADDVEKPVINQDVASLRNLHERLRAQAMISPARTPGAPLEHGFDFSPAEDVGQQARDAVQKTQGALPRGERRAIPRTPEEMKTQELFGQARKELGEDASSDQVMARVEQLKSQPRTDVPSQPTQPKMTLWRYDSRTGRETQIQQGEMAKPRANEIVFQRDPNGGEKIVSKGNSVKNVELPKNPPEQNVGVDQTKADEQPQNPNLPNQPHKVKVSKAEAGAVTPQALLDLRKLPGEFWKKFIVDPILKKAGLGPKYSRIKEASPTLTDLFKRRDNIAHAAREQAAANVKEILGGADHAKERLAALWADADSRANLQKNHPQEYQQAATDPEVQAIVQRYQKFEQELTNERAQLGFKTLPGDYLRRVYDEHLSGGKSGTQPFEKAVSFQDLPNKSRQASAEWHYQNGRHEFGPSYGTKYIAQKMIALDRAVVNQMAREGQVVPKNSSLPKSIQFAGKTYYSPEEARAAKSKDVYGVYDPLKTTKFKIGENVVLAPREITDAAAREGRYTPIDYKPGALKTGLQKGVIGLGFGVPHAFANIPRRIMNSYSLGAANPLGWARTFKVIFGKELRARSEAGMKDPVLRELVNRGAARLDSEGTDVGSKWAGLRWGHDLIFNPGTIKGLGGVDVRARMDYADRLINSNPKMKWSDIADKVEGQFGQYTKENWTKTQGSAAHVVAFPGWIYSSIRAGLEHPIRNTAGAAAIIYSLNQALYKAGMNRREDKDDISRIHVGNYAVSPTVFSEPFSKATALPAMMAAQPLIRGGSSREVIDTFLENIPKQSGKVLYNLVPYYAAPIELAFNRQYAGSEREIYRQGAFDRKGKVFSEGTEALLRHTATRIIPQMGRLAPEGEASFDLPSFLGSQAGLPMFRQDAEQRLQRNVGITNKASRLWGDYKAQQPQNRGELLKSEPTLALDLRFQPIFEHLTKGMRRIDNEIMAHPEAKAQLEKAREQLLKNADEINDKYYELREEQLRAYKGLGAERRQAVSNTSALPESLDGNVK